MAEITHDRNSSPSFCERADARPGRPGNAAKWRIRDSVAVRHLAGWLMLLFQATLAEAGKSPLRPEELQQQADLIVVGNVLSHFASEKVNKDGSETTHVYLKVRVLEVGKGTDAAEGETVEIGCWVITKAPRRGTVWDSGNSGIPADDAKARFFLKRHGSQLWNTISPNGIERLDDGPTLDYPMQPADPAPSPIVAIAVGLVVFLIATVAFTWLFLSRGPAANTG